MAGTLLVCGVGLIGGSFALAQNSALARRRTVGLDRAPESLERARALGVIDEIATDWSSALEEAELVMLCTPVGQMPAVLEQLAPHLKPHTLVTDCGSTKSDVIAVARRILGARIAQFVPGHPIAGAEKSGVEAAKGDLFLNKRVVLTPLPENSPQALSRVRQAWEACGAQVTELSPEAHDAVFAAVSHLPHLLAFALVHDLAGRPNSDELFGFAASGFRDFTRIASSHPEMWRDICVANRAALLAELDAYMEELMRTRLLLAGADAAGLEKMFLTARERRDAWLEEYVQR